MRSRSVVASAEPAAAEGRLHGGAGGGSQEAPPRVPLHGPPALRQAEETTGRVRIPGRSASCHHVIIYFCSQSGGRLFLCLQKCDKKANAEHDIKPIEFYFLLNLLPSSTLVFFLFLCLSAFFTHRFVRLNLHNVSVFSLYPLPVLHNLQ